MTEGDVEARRKKKRGEEETYCARPAHLLLFIDCFVEARIPD